MKPKDLANVKFRLSNKKPPKGVTCFSCIHIADGTFGPKGYTARCGLNHLYGGCCEIVHKPCGFYEADRIKLTNHETEKSKVS